MPGDLKLILVMLAAFIGGAVPASAAEPSTSRIDVSSVRGATVPGEVIVRFDRGATPDDRRAARRAASVSFEQSLEVPRAQLVAADGVKTAIKRLEAQPGVAYAQPNYRYRASAADTFLGDLWGLKDSSAPDPGVDAIASWDTTRGAGQVIAVVDTGVALDHPDLANNVWTGPNGIHGHDFVDGDTDPDDYDFHGTHVAGTAAAVADNGLGIAGVAPDAQIMAVRVLDGDGSGSSADIGDGIAFAAHNGADVINLSLGGPAGGGDVFMSNAVTVADQANAVVVVAAGNDSKDNDLEPTTPCNLPQANLICVAAVNRSGGLAGFSNFGAKSVDVGAPGTSILSAKNDYRPVFEEDFDTGLAAWDSFTAAGSSAWARTTSQFSSGTHSVTDSPAGPYANDTDSELFAAAPLDLGSERGCRVHVDLLYDIQSPDSDGSFFDFLFVGGVTNDPDTFDGVPFAGRSFGYASGTFFEEEASISDLDGRNDVFPFLGLSSDEAVQADGAYADDLTVECRDDSYLDDKTDAGNYVVFQGTSMATPHVAGVAALVRAADPGISDTQVVRAIKEGGTPLGSLAGKTVSGGTADAGGAIATALALPNTPPQQPTPPASLSRSSAPVPTAPARPDLSRSPKALRISKRGVLKYSFRATPGLTGQATFRTRVKAVVSRRTRLTIGSKSFKVPSTGRVTVKVRLSKKQRRTLRRNRRLLLNATVVVRNAAGLSSRARKRLTVRPPRR